MGVILCFFVLLVPSFLFVYNLTAAICRGNKNEDNEGNLILASVALSALVLLGAWMAG